MKRNTRKGFTGIELVIVIAIIAILASALIPTFGGLFQGANKTADTQLVRNLNAALLSDTDGVETMGEALALAEEYGFDVAKINAKALNNEILWDSERNVFCYFNDGKIEYMNEEHEELENKQNYWVISGDEEDRSGPYSVYYVGNETEVVTYTGFDAGKSGVTQVTYIDNTTSGKTVTIRTTGGTLIVRALEGTVEHEGTAETVLIHAVHTASYHEFGEVNYIEIGYGHVEIEAGAKVNTVVAVEASDDVKAKLGEETPVVIITNESGNDVKGFAVDGVNIGGNSMVDMTKVAENEVYAIKQGATKFAGGTGTFEDPFLIANAEHFKNISEFYDTYKYYEVADGVSTIDMTGVGRINLHGSFNGNGVKLINLNTALFERVGYQNANETIKISNVEAIMNSTDGRAFVRNIYNSGKTTFENVKLHGYLEGLYNLGSFYNYGTANYDDIGASYTVEFINATSDMTIVCTSGNIAGGFLGHSFEGAGNSFTMIIDANSAFNGKILTTTGKGNLYFAMTSDYNNANNKFVVNGEEIKFDNGNIPSATNVGKITVVNPKKENDEWVVDKATGTTSVIVSITSQHDLYDADGNKLVNGSGMTVVLGTIEISDLDAAIKVLGAVNSVEYVNEYIDGKMAYTLENGVLKAYVGSRNILSGTIRIQVAQYDGNGSIIATGTTILGTVTK